MNNVTEINIAGWILGIVTDSNHLKKNPKGEQLTTKCENKASS